MTSLARRPVVLIVLHQEHSTPGRVGQALRAMDARLDIRRPCLGEPLPATLAEHDGAVVFGGPMCANDCVDWVRREIDWLAVPLAERKPLLGICLGAQMLALQLGARVFSYEDKRSGIRLFPDPAERRRRPALRGAIPALRLSVAFGRVRPAGGRRIARHGRPGFPQSGLPLRRRRRVAVPPGSDLPHDVQVDTSRRGEVDPPGGAAAARPPRRLVPARREGGGLARSLPPGVARRAARRGKGPRGGARPGCRRFARARQNGSARLPFLLASR